jgi:hypothetical protein
MTAERMTQHVVMTLRDDGGADDRGADDTTRCDDLLRRMTLRNDGGADDRGADDTTRCDDPAG